MALRFTRLKWRNFLSTGNVDTVVDLGTSNSTLIVGENGAGKSTILDALTFALFGRPFRNISKTQLINSITRKQCVAEVEFEIGSNKYKIIRGMKPTRFEVYCNGTLLNQAADSRDYQSTLESQILKRNYKTFCQVDILGNASYVPFMQLNAASRRLVIEDLLDLQVFTTMNTLLKQRIQQNQESVAANASEQRLLQQKLQLVTKHLAELQSTNELFVEEKSATLRELREKQAQVHHERERLKEEARCKQESVPATTDLSASLKEAQQLRAQLQAKMALLEKETYFFSHNAQCPTCRQAISEEFRCEETTSRNVSIEQCRHAVASLDQVINTRSASIEEARRLDKEADKAREKVTHETLRIQMISDQINAIEEEIERARTKVSEQTTERVVDIEAELSKVNTAGALLLDQRAVLHAAGLLLKDGGIKTKIINMYVPLINKLINKYLSEFDLFVEFSLDEQFNEVIRSRYRDEFSYASFSEGEKQKIDLAILFTWRAIAKLRNTLNSNLLILDEVFDNSLDSNAADDLLRILEQIAKDTSVFVISHRENLHDKFNNVLRVVKHQNFSKIVEGVTE